VRSRHLSLGLDHQCKLSCTTKWVTSPSTTIRRGTALRFVRGGGEGVGCRGFTGGPRRSSWTHQRQPLRATPFDSMYSRGTTASKFFEPPHRRNGGKGDLTESGDQHGKDESCDGRCDYHWARIANVATSAKLSIGRHARHATALTARAKDRQAMRLGCRHLI
jgi:hypothetical protein